MKDQRQEIVLAVDFSIDQLDVSLRQSDKRWVWPHRGYNNNWPGFQQLKQDLLTELSRQPGTQLTAVGESTGSYWWHAFYGLSHDEDLVGYDPALVVLNPARVKAYRKALPEGVQCYAIAAATSKESNKLRDDLVGDGLVPISSALGRHKRAELNLLFPETHQWIGRNMNHLDLLNHSEVYETIKK